MVMIRLCEESSHRPENQDGYVRLKELVSTEENMAFVKSSDLGDETEVGDKKGENKETEDKETEQRLDRLRRQLVEVVYEEALDKLRNQLVKEVLEEAAEKLEV